MLKKVCQSGLNAFVKFSKVTLWSRRRLNELAYELIRKRNDYRLPDVDLMISDISSLPEKKDSTSRMQKYLHPVSIKFSENHPANILTLKNYSKKAWPLFIENLSGEISVTLGYRKAFSECNPFAVYHLVFLVADSEHKAGIFGYNKSNSGNNGNYIHNDFVNDFSNYYLYSQLTIHGKKSTGTTTL